MNTQQASAGKQSTPLPPTALHAAAMVVHGHHPHYEAHQQHHLVHPVHQPQHHYPHLGFPASGGNPFADHVHFAVPALPNTAMESNEGSSQESSMVRSDTTMTVAPLNEAEYATLISTLNGDIKQGGTFDMLQTPSTSQATDSWIISNHDPNTTQALNAFHHDPNLTEASRSSSTVSAGLASELELARADTLETNPNCVNPHNVSNRTEPVVVHQIQFAGGEIITLKDQPGEDNLQQWANLAVDSYGGGGGGGGGGIPPPTCAMPSLVQWPGEYNFKVSFLQLTQSAKNKAWDYSPDLNKLFIDMGKVVQIAFSAGNNPPENLFVRALPVYGVSTSFKDPVIRCPNHAAMTDASNTNFPEDYRDHLIRVQHDAAIYDRDHESERLSVIVPFERPQQGTDYCSHLYKFMCLGSDVGGINRRPLKVIFTLELGLGGEVVGRYNLDVRICSCPKRDRKQDEEKALEDRNKVVGLASSLARSTSVFSKPSAKKRKTEVEEFVMVPVAKADFEKLNEFAEAAVVVRNPDRAKEIKEQRRKLLDMHNKKHLNNKPK